MEPTTFAFRLFLCNYETKGADNTYLYSANKRFHGSGRPKPATRTILLWFARRRRKYSGLFAGKKKWPRPKKRKIYTNGFV